MGMMRDFDETDAAFLFRALCDFKKDNPDIELRNDGELGEVQAMWSCAVGAAQWIHQNIHESEYGEHGVWAYEMCDKDSLLARMLWEGLDGGDQCPDFPGLTHVMLKWKKDLNLRGKDDPPKTPENLIYELLEVGDNMGEMTKLHRQADEFLRRLAENGVKLVEMPRMEKDVELGLRQLIEKVIVAVADYKLKIPASLWAELNRAVK